MVYFGRKKSFLPLFFWDNKYVDKNRLKKINASVFFKKKVV